MSSLASNLKAVCCNTKKSRRLQFLLLKSQWLGQLFHTNLWQKLNEHLGEMGRWSFLSDELECCRLGYQIIEKSTVTIQWQYSIQNYLPIGPEYVFYKNNVLFQSSWLEFLMFFFLMNVTIAMELPICRPLNFETDYQSGMHFHLISK